jgi:hypothetical protein
MAKSYKITKTIKFDRDSFSIEPFSLGRQFILDGIPPEPQTKVYRGRDQIKYEDFERYIIEHEMEEIAFRRINDSAFQKFIRKEFIYAFSSNIKMLLILSGKKKFVLDFCRKTIFINEIKLNTLTIDMGSLLTKLPHVKGVWFHFNNGLVRASALMGTNLESTSDFQKFKNEGDISTLSFLYEFNNTLHPIMVTNDGTIVLYNNYKEIADEIALVLSVFDNLLIDIALFIQI